jgi:hypothetical protein
VTWNSYNQFMHSLDSGWHLFPVLAVLAALMAILLVLRGKARRGGG